MLSAWIDARDGEGDVFVLGKLRTTDLAIYFCDRHTPWKRGSNENTNGLLRQCFPKSTDLTVHTPERLLEVTTELTGRSRKTLGYRTPAEAFEKCRTSGEFLP